MARVMLWSVCMKVGVTQLNSLLGWLRDVRCEISELILKLAQCSLVGLVQYRSGMA